MKSFIILLFIIGSFQYVFCQADTSRYSILNLPENLKTAADAVFRTDEEVIEITSSSKYSSKLHQVITLLNSDAGHYLDYNLRYNKFEKIENAEIKLYDAAGKLIRKYHKKDFKTIDYDDNFSLFIDEKILHLQIADLGYPCTIEILAETKNTGYVDIPDWYISSPDVSVENSVFTIKVATGLDIRHRELRTDIKPTITETSDYKIYNWVAKNIPALKMEKHSYETGFYYPKIEVSPLQFEYDGYKGNFESWQNFGAWNYQLYEDNNSFTNARIDELNALTANGKTDKEKVKILYMYLQKNMRYVSIQLGIGGFKPFPVKYVEEKKYGDCKALTNYMRYMLKAVGIQSYPALVNAGANKIPADINFPSDPFNHVILCVPLDKDSIWLECTSNSNEFGVLGAFTENRYALLLTEKGGILVATPKSHSNENILNTKTEIYLNEEGGSKAISSIYCRGDFLNLFYEIMKQNKEEQKTIFIKYLDYKIPEYFQLENSKDSVGGKLFTLNLSYDQQYDFKSGNKLFFQPRINKLCTEEIIPAAIRKFDYLFDFPYFKTDTTIYILPAGAYVENLPANKIISNDYTYYSSEFFKNDAGNIITAVAKFSIKKINVTPKSYPIVATFFQQMMQNENEKIIIKKK